MIKHLTSRYLRIPVKFSNLRTSARRGVTFAELILTLFIRTQNRGAVRESLNMSGLQSLRILTLVLVSVVATVDSGSGGFLSTGNLCFKLFLLCSLRRATFCLVSTGLPFGVQRQTWTSHSPANIEAHTVCPLYGSNLTSCIQCIASMRDLHGVLVFHSFSYHYLFQLTYLHLTYNNTCRLISRSSSPPTVACKLEAENAWGLTHCVL